MPFNHISEKAQADTNLHESQEKVNYLMCLDVIQLFAKNEKELEILRQAVRIYCQGIGMKFGIEKYAMLI